MIPVLLVAGALLLPPLRVQRPDGTLVLRFRPVAGAVAYGTTGTPISGPNVCPSASVAAGFACRPELHGWCELPVSSLECFTSVKVWDGAAYGTPKEEARVSCELIGGSGCPICVYPSPVACP